MTTNTSKMQPLIFTLLFTALLTIVHSQSTDSEQLGYLVKFTQDYELKDNRLMIDDKLESALHWNLLSESQNIYQVNWREDVSEDQVVQYIEQLPSVLLFHKNAKVESRERGIKPNDPELNLQWYIEKIKADLAWTQSTGGISAAGDTLVIALLEREGGDFAHEDFSPSLFWLNKSEIPGNGIDDDNNGYIDDYFGVNLVNMSDMHTPELSPHATPIIGILGAQTDNGVGVAGINWNVKIMMISGCVDVARIVQGYEYVYQMRKRYNQSNGAEGALVVGTNASFGIDSARPSDFPIWCEMYDVLGELGVLSVGSTSNLNVDVDVVGDLPSNCDSDFLIVATSTNIEDEKERTGFGVTSVDLGAPGEAILTTFPNHQYQTGFGGTSAAAPMVSGGIALMFSMPNQDLARDILEDPVNTAIKIKNAILEGVDNLPDLKGKTTSEGRLNLSKSMFELARHYEIQPAKISISRLSPNPVTSELSIVFNSSFYEQTNEILVFDVLGKLMISDLSYPAIFGETIHKMDVSGLLPGTYFLTIRNGKVVESTSFVKMH